MSAILASIISGGLALIGVVITVQSSQRKTENTLKTEIAVMNTEISSLRKEVEKHNNFATRIPALETQVGANKVAIGRLENFHME